MGSHLEKLCLISDGVGRDNISDFTTNLIHGFLLEYTQYFARTFVNTKHRRQFRAAKVRFNYTSESWEPDSFDLPFHDGDYVLLTPKDLLTKDETWINKPDLIDNFSVIPTAISDDALRAQVNNYFSKVLPKDKKGEPSETKKDKRAAAASTLREFPESSTITLNTRRSTVTMRKISVRGE